jgi:glycine cleavage system H protein
MPTQCPEQLLYAETHEWIKIDGDTATVGITNHAQEQLGDVVFVELPEVDTKYEAGQEVSVVESVKAASDIYTPVTGTITEVNTALEDSPELVNEEPFKNGWLYKIQINDATQMQSLMSAKQYQNQINEE